MREEARTVTLTLVGEPQAELEAQEVATFVYDLNLLYELRVLEITEPESVMPAYATTWILSRTGRPVPPATRLLIRRLHYGSPVEVVLQLRDLISSFDFAVASGAIWVTVQTIEKLYNLPANHRLIEAQRRLADAQAKETDRAQLNGHVLPNGIDESSDRQRSRPPVIDPIRAAENRLRKARIKITEIDLDVR